MSTNTLAMLFAGSVPLALDALGRLFCSYWLFRIWRRRREATYLWLLVGIGPVALLLSPFAIMLVGQFLARTVFPFLLTTSAGGTAPITLVVQTSDMVAEWLQHICIFIGLSKLAGGAVGFRDLWRRERVLVVVDTNGLAWYDLYKVG